MQRNIPSAIKDVVETFTRASGPGGQNVNKVETCVQLLHRPTGIIVKCHQYRTQALNRQEAWRLLDEAIKRKAQEKILCLRQAMEKKRRQNRKRSKGAKEKMLVHKKKHSLKKQNRKGPSRDE